MREDNFEPATVPTPVITKNASEDNEDDDWEVLGDFQEKKTASYASMVSKKPRKVRAERKV
jgi:hypothetical protein